MQRDYCIKQKNLVSIKSKKNIRHNKTSTSTILKSFELMGKRII